MKTQIGSDSELGTTERLSFLYPIASSPRSPVRMRILRFAICENTICRKDVEMSLPEHFANYGACVDYDRGGKVRVFLCMSSLIASMPT